MMINKIFRSIQSSFDEICFYALAGIALFSPLFVVFFPSFAQSQEQGTVNHISDMPIGLKIDNISVGDSPTGLIVVEGTVHNNSTEDIVNVEVKVNLFDSDDELIIETMRFITPASSVFKPGYERDFDFLVTAKNVDHYNITAFGNKAQ